MATARCVSITVVLLTVSVAMTAHAQEHAIIRPGDICDSGGGFVGISADGLSLAGLCNQDVYFWSEGSELVQFPLDLGSPYTVTGISGNGEAIVGNINLLDKGFVARKDMTVETIDFLSTEGANTEIAAADYDGSRVVGSSVTQALEWQGIIYQSQSLTGIGYAEGYPESRVNSVSADGTILVGEAFRYPPMSKTGEAFRWTESGFELLGIPEGYLGTVANAVSDDGTVVAGSAYSAVGVDYQADGAVWAEGEGWRIIPQMDEIHAISPDGSAVVGSSLPEGRGWYLELIKDEPQTTESILANEFGLGGIIDPPLDLTLTNDALYLLWSSGLFVVPKQQCTDVVVEWNDPSNGSFDDPQSWLTLEVPRPDTIAVLPDLGTSYQINAESSRLLAAIHVDAGAEVTLALDPYEYSINWDCDFSGLRLNGDLTVFGGGIKSAGTVDVGDQTRGRLQLVGGATMVVDHPIGPYVRVDGPSEAATLRIDSESIIDVKHQIQAGYMADHTGEIEVEGGMVAGGLLIGVSGSGSVTATGSGNIVAEMLSLGSQDNGQGELIVEDSALVFTQCMEIGEGVGSLGTLEISGHAALTDECPNDGEILGRITIGRKGLGIASVSDHGSLGGSDLQPVDIILGLEGGAEGQLTVTSPAVDTFEALPNVGTVYVGGSGSGLLRLTGANVKETNLVVGFLEGSEGVVELSDAGWTFKGKVIVGGLGGDGRVELRRSSIHAEELSLGVGSGSTGTLHLLQANLLGSQVIDTLVVGESGVGEVLVTGGNRLLSAVIEIPSVGAAGDGEGEVTVDGAGSKIDASNIQVGGGGNGGTLRVINNGSIEVGTLTVFGPDGTTTIGGTVTSDLTLVGVPDLGKWGVEVSTVYADTLILRAGAKLETDSLELGEAGVLVVADTLRQTLVNAGELSPGDGYLAPGKLTLGKDYVQTSSGILKVDLGGTESGSFDVLEVDGAIELDGGLRIKAVDGYEPKVGDTFLIVSGSTVSGTFSRVEVVDGFRVDVSYGDGDISIFVVSLVGVEDVGPVAEIPTANRLAQNYPNPFTSVTTIAYELATAADITLAVFDALGRVVQVMNAGWQPAGRHEAAFDASALPSGIYLYRLTIGDKEHTKRMLVIR